MNRSFYLTLLCLLLSRFTLAAVLKGTITDEKGKPLGFATVLIEGTTIGTSANGDGVYTLQLTPGSYSVTCQFIGYSSETRQVTISGNLQTLDFQLQEQQLKMAEVVINSEDPAYAIMRKVIEKRAYYANLVKTLETDIYLKGTLRTGDFPDNLKVSVNDDDKAALGLDSNGKGILFLLEELSHYYYKAPDKNFNKVTSVRQSGDPQGLGFAMMPPILNIYENNISNPISVNGMSSQRGFISPASSNAFHYYRYHFLGNYLEDGRTIDKIKVTPKRKYEPCFSGYVYVVDGEWVFSSVDLLLTQASQITPLDTLKLKQYYRPVDNGVWIIQNQVLYPELRIFGIDFSGNFVTTYSNQKVNQVIDDSIFHNKVIAAYDSNAIDHKITYWDTVRPMPLAKDEVKDFKFKDSLYIVQKEKADSLKNRVIYNYDFVFSGFNIKYKNNNFHVRPLVGAVAFNSVEGISATLDMDYRYKAGENAFHAEWLNRYAFGNKHYNSLLKAGITVGDTSWKGRNWGFELSGGRYVYQINNDNPISPFMNELYTLIGGRNYMKLYENRLGRIKVSRNWGNGFSAELLFSYEHRMPLANTTDYTFAARHDGRITPNQPSNLPLLKKEDAAIFALSLSYQPGWHYISYPTYKMPVESSWPQFSLHYTKGVPGLFSAVSNFDKWKVTMQHQLRLRMLGSLSYRLGAGGFLNKEAVNLPDYKHLYGNRTFLANPFLQSFQLAPYYRFSNIADFYLEGHAEWHLEGLLSNKIPLFRRLNWYLLAGSNALWINRDNYYAEVFVGLENIGLRIFRFGRVDFIAGYESGKTKPSLGIRISLGQFFEALLGMQKDKEL